MGDELIEKLRQMLGVRVDKVEEQGEGLLIHVPKAQVAKAIGSGGSVVRSAELVLKKKLTIRESTDQ
jgi:transcription antitermination factor NusA-like protein